MEDNNKNMVNESIQQKQKEVKKPVKLERYDEIERKVDEALSRGDIEEVLLLNELTLARNLDKTGLDRTSQREFSSIFVAFKGHEGVVKRAGVYNTKVFNDAENAEDILIAEDFKDERVLAVPRNSVFIEILK